MKTAWFSVCSSAAASANAAQLSAPRARRTQAGAEPEHDDPDVLDRVEREQPLQVVLEERVHDAADRRERAEREHEHAEPERQHAEPVDEHPDERRRSATLIITPLISADTGAGAIGCARGSQTCSGITPAFVPIPTSAASAIAICRPEPRADRAPGRRSRPACASSRTAIQVPAPPRWVTAT